MKTAQFYYFGDDEAYLKTLAGEFKTSSRMTIEFKRFYESDEKKIQSLFLKIFKEKPDCLFIDFSKHSQDYLHLARLISRTPLEHEMIVVGLVDYLSPPEVLTETIATGIHLTHIKGPECFDVIFDVIKIMAPEEIGDHAFAKAGLKEAIEGGLPVKVGYLKADSIHFETDYKLQKNEKFRLNHEWTKKRLVPSRDFTARQISTNNIFYQFKYAVDADFGFIDEYVPAEGIDEERIAEKKQEREDLLLYHKKQLSKWITDHMTDSAQKRSKILIIDRSFSFLSDQNRTDKHPYTLRCIPYLQDIRHELERLDPQIIVFCFEREDDEEIIPKNTNDVFQKLLNFVKNAIQDTSPFIIVFNSKFNSKQMQDSYGYAHLMASEQDLSVDVLLKMAEALDKKLNVLGGPPTPKEERKVYLKKSNPASIAEIVVPLTITKISETDMTLQCELPLTDGMNLHLTHPVEMYVNVRAKKSQSKIPEYHGLIHALGEKEKEELRRYVNTIFFRDHDARVLAEIEEFKKLNESKLHERQEALKRIMEAREAAEAAKDDSKKEPV